MHDTDHAVHLFGETIMFGELYRRPDDTIVPLSEQNDLVAQMGTEVFDKNHKEIFEGDRVKCVYKRDEIDKELGEKEDYAYEGIVEFRNGNYEIWNGDEFIDLVGNNEYPPREEVKTIEILGTIFDVIAPAPRKGTE